MLKKIILIILCIFVVTGCDYKKELGINGTKQNNENEVTNYMRIFIDGKEYIVNLEDNETTKSFIKILPLEINMNDLNNNEKYAYLDVTLPTNSINPKYISAGDVMLYGNNCLVIFYKSFTTNYSYTKIGHIDNMVNLGNNEVKVKIEY